MRIALIVIVLLGVLGMSTLAQGVSDERYAQLARGVNLSHWFSQSFRGYGEEHLRTFITDGDLALIRDVGLSHVRFPVDPAVLMDDADPTRLDEKNLALFDSAVQRMLAHGLAVVVDMHPESKLKHRLRDEPAFAAQFETFLGALAKHVSSTDAERVFIEVLNEPEFNDAKQWQELQGRLLKALRAGAPRHTLVASGAGWSSLKDLEKLEPYDDANVIYNYHNYEPTLFTHQGANWGWALWRHLRSMPYPSSPEAVERVLGEQGNDEARKHAMEYGEQRWDAKRVAADVARAAAWGRKHGVRVTCNEFGVYRKVSPGGDRERYLGDLVSAMESAGIGWTMWDYRGGFSLVNSAEGGRVVDRGTAQALGLHVN